MTNETKRDLHADLALCAAATPGPWYATENSVATEPNEYCGYPPNPKSIADLFDGEYIENPNARADAHFIAAAREGWPHAIERAIASETRLEVAEAENADLRADILHSSRVLYEAQRYIDELESALKQEGRLIERAAKILEHAVPAYKSAEWLRDYDELRGDSE